MMVNRLDSCRVSKYVVFYVLDDGILLPTLLPQFVQHLHVFICAVVPFIMGQLLSHPVAVGTGKIGRHNVPANTTVGKMIERREELRRVIWGIIRGAVGYDKAEILCDL